MVEELGLQNSNTSNTYCRMFKPNTDIIKNNQTILVGKNLKCQGIVSLLQIPERDGLMIKRIARLCSTKLT